MVKVPKHRKLEVVNRHPDVLIPYAHNAREHSKAQLKKLVASIEEFGFTNPILIDDGMNVLAGHGRLMAAKLLGMTSVPTIMLANMSEAQVRAYILADNAIATKAGWSKDLLRHEFSGLVALGYDVELTGFDTLEIDTLISMSDDDPKEDVIELLDEREPPICQLGDLWSIGWHRLFVGDARVLDSYARLLGNERAELIIADPPYGCAIAGNVSRNRNAEDFVMGCDGVGPELAHGLLRPALKCMRVYARPGAIAFVFMDWRGLPALWEAAQGIFHEIKNLIVWSKTNASMGFYRSAHELIYVFKVSPGKHINNFGLRRHRTNVWVYSGANTFRRGRKADLDAHPTIKNKNMIADAILDVSKPGGIVLDGFAGSGTTLVSAHMTNRRGFGIELDPKYADLILKRLSEAVGEEPTLEDGRTLSEVTHARTEEP
ncbi:site-specific DNA-methyltransferase [Tsuneonella rigui]|uniref:site-specific DNA-methyltransferase n=1 Tax=Tsuneonella rigui TaxID=1708790 RepID=UPI000F7E52FB|nr:DNA methyltransferase [Tsuneonella rigui]